MTINMTRLNRHGLPILGSPSVKKKTKFNFSVNESLARNQVRQQRERNIQDEKDAVQNETPKENSSEQR